jgi:hypothetical protein
MENIFNIGQKPNENWHIESPIDDEKFPRFVVNMDIKSIEVDYFILDHDVKIVFERAIDNTNGTLEFSCVPSKRYINQNDKEISFYTLLTSQKYYDIENFRSGDNLRVQLLINHLYLVSFPSGKLQRVKADSGTSISRNAPNVRYCLTVKHDVTKFNDSDHRLLILREHWVEKVIKPYSMTDRFIVEIPYKLSDMADTTPPDEDDLKILKSRLEKGIALLRSAISEYAGAKDHKKCITNVREISDLLHTIQHKKSSDIGSDCIRLYGSRLVEDTRTGSTHISHEMIEDIFGIIDKIFNISSKVPHAVTRGPGVPFDYDPDYEDAQMLLGVISLIYYWISVKLEKSMIMK